MGFIWYLAIGAGVTVWVFHENSDDGGCLAGRDGREMALMGLLLILLWPPILALALSHYELE
jgi:hypothetical protein